MERSSGDGIAAFLQGDGTDAPVVREHLRLCSACADLVEDYALAFSLPSGPGWEFGTGRPEDHASNRSEGDLDHR